MGIGAEIDALGAGATLGAEATAEVTVEGAADVTEAELEGEIEAEAQADAEAGSAESSQGQWVNESYNNPQAEAYDQQIMDDVGGEAQPGRAFKLNNVKFDGIDSEGNLIEAKGPGYAKLFKLPFAQNVEQQIAEQVGRQLTARAGKQIIWHIAEKDAMPVFQRLVTQGGGDGIIRLVLTPFTAP